MGLLLGHWTSPAAKLIALGVIVFGRLGGLNQYCSNLIIDLLYNAGGR
jgi:hypothetical protein